MLFRSKILLWRPSLGSNAEGLLADFPLRGQALAQSLLAASCICLQNPPVCKKCIYCLESGRPTREGTRRGSLEPRCFATTSGIRGTHQKGLFLQKCRKFPMLDRKSLFRRKIILKGWHMHLAGRIDNAESEVRVLKRTIHPWFVVVVAHKAGVGICPMAIYE